jgi:hypothetical protein
MIEQMKKSYYSIYKMRKCVYCNQEDENFDHVWNCSQRLVELNELCLLHHEILLTEINDYLKEEKKPVVDFDIIAGLNDILWDTKKLGTKFNFIDVIKGIIPLSLSDKICLLTNNRESTKIIIYKYRQKFVSNVNFYWKKRCDLTKDLDKNLGINKKSLKKNKGVERYNEVRIDSNEPKYEGLLGVRNHIYFGGKPLGFTIYMDFANLIRCS